MPDSTPVTFNLFTILAAVLIGALAGAAGARGARRGLITALFTAAAVGMTGSFAAIVAGVAITSPDAFAIIHVVYLILTLGVPLAAIIVAATSDVGGLGRSLLLLPVLAVPLGLYASYVEPFWLRVDRVTFQTDVLAPAAAEAKPVRIGVLSDLQTVEISDYENRAIDELLATEPDIVLIPGDFSQLDTDRIDRSLPEFAAVLQRLDSEVDHVIAVNGNSDSVLLLRRMAEGTNVVVLDSEVIDLVVAGHPMRIGGISLFGDDGRAQQAVAELAVEEEGVFRLLLAHKPDEIDRLAPGASVDLIVAGHTHGGQVSLPFFGPPITLSNVPRSVAAGGLSDINGQPIYVSTGVGRERHRAPQLRFGARPSIAIIELARS